jgi:hypothetical protein
LFYHGTLNQYFKNFFAFPFHSTHTHIYIYREREREREREGEREREKEKERERFIVLTTQTDSWPAVEGKILPSSLPVLLPAFWSEQLGVWAIVILTAVHYESHIADTAAFGYEGR